MAKPKAKTLQQKLGFFDEDLKSPDHDSILKWLDKNIDSVLGSIYNFRKWNQNHVEDLQNKALEIKELEIKRLTEELEGKESSLSHEKSSLSENRERLKKELEEEKEKEETTYKSSEWILDRINSAQTRIAELEVEIPKIKDRIEWVKEFSGLDEKDLPERKKPRVFNVKWEYTVTNQTFNSRTGYISTKSVIGFIDMRVDFVYTKLYIKGLDENGKFKEHLSWGQTEKKSQSEYDREALTKSLMIEVKTKIPSLGELFRQLNTYREYESGDFLVVCPDDSEKETIRNQGFLFYKYEPD